jgi:light-regulated signal transduction histidine kinase (bacteriophytochrome)
VNLLQKRCDDRASSEEKEYMDFITDATHRMHDLVSDLLTYSRIGREKSEALFINCNELIKDIQANMKSAIKENNAEIIFEKLPTIKAHEIYLKMLFQNLISNAIKFRKKQVAPKIEIKFEQNETEWIFHVIDNGIGIEKQYHPRIFQLFQRLHTRDIYDGTGIGLTNSKKIVELHGGTIGVESDKGKGATFYFSIPK